MCICYKKELQLFTGAAGVEHVQGYATPAHAHAGCAGLLRSGDRLARLPPSRSQIRKPPQGENGKQTAFNNFMLCLQLIYVVCCKR